MADDQIPDKYIKAVGNIALNSSALEFDLLYEIIRLTRLSYREALCLVGGENFEILMAKLTRLFYHYVIKQELLDEFESLKTEISRVNTERNEYIHRFWSLDGNEVTRWQFSKRFNKKPIPSKPESVDLAKLESLSQEMLTAADKMVAFISLNLEYIHTEYDKRKKEENEKIQNNSSQEI